MGNETGRMKRPSASPLPPFGNFNMTMYDIESKLYGLQSRVEQARAHTHYVFDDYADRLSTFLDQLDGFQTRIKIKRAGLMKQLNKCRSIAVRRGLNTLPVRFVNNSQHLSTMLCDMFVFEGIYRTRSPDARSNIARRMKYLELYDQFESVDASHLIDPDCYNYIIVPISRSRFLIAMAIFDKKSFIKIVDRSGQVLHKMPIKKNFYYRQFVAYGDHIAAIYDDMLINTNVIEIYNQELELMAAKHYDHRLDLLYMNNHELVCKSRQLSNLFFFFSFKLEQIYSVRASSGGGSGGGGVGDANVNTVQLLGSNPTEIYIFGKTKRVIKKLDRLSGQVVYEIRVNGLNIDHVSQLKLDTRCNFLFKLGSQMNYYNFERGKMMEAWVSSAINEKFNHFELTSSDEVCSVDTLNKKIYFL